MIKSGLRTERRITDRAWQKGEAAAEMIFKRYNGERMIFLELQQKAA
jgi:hypothetical protein